MTEEKELSGGPSRVLLTPEEECTLPPEVAIKWRQLDGYIGMLERKSLDLEADVSAARGAEERARSQISQLSHRERILMRRLTHKDHEAQEYMAQIAELKAAQAPGPAALRSAVLDPAVNILLLRLRQELVAHKTKLEETQSELSAWKFTPDSNTGKRLMAKCRLLYQENEELGRVVSSGRLAKLEGDLALQKKFSDEVRKAQSELDEFLQDLDEDLEGMQGTVYLLQQELLKAKGALTNNCSDANNSDSGATERTREREEGLTNGGRDDDAPLAKRVRRGSEVSLDYNDDPLQGMTNGDC